MGLDMVLPVIQTVLFSWTSCNSGLQYYVMVSLLFSAPEWLQAKSVVI